MSMHRKKNSVLWMKHQFLLSKKEIPNEFSKLSNELLDGKNIESKLWKLFNQYFSNLSKKDFLKHYMAKSLEKKQKTRIIVSDAPKPNKKAEKAA